MNDSNPSLESNQSTENINNTDVVEPQASYVKLAMRNMVRKGGISIKHFLLTTIGLLSLLIGLAYLTR
jgi:Protein of unknown function (DUF3285)